MKKLFASLIMLVASITLANAALYIGGTTVDMGTSKNGITGSNFSGTVNWNASTKTLTLKDVSISGGINGIYLYNIGTDSGSGITINLEGDVSIATQYHGIRVEGSYVTFTGNANKITINGSSSSSGYSGINLIGGSTMRVWNTYLEIKNYANAMWGSSTDVFSGIRLFADITGTTQAVKGFKTFDVTEDCSLFTTGAKFVSGTGVTDASGNVLKDVDIRPNLTVGRLIVRTASNSFSEGVYSWNGSSKTLTISSGYNASSNHSAISNFNIDGLTISLPAATVGSSSDAINIYKATTFKTPSGKATVSASGTGIYPHAAVTLTFDNCTMDVSGDYGIDGEGIVSKQADVKFTNCEMKVTGTNSSMGRLKSATYSGCEVTTDGLTFLNGYILNGQTTYYAGTIEIKKSTSYGIKVLGKEITNLNYNNFKVDGLTAGTVTYNNSTKTLTLNGVTLTSPSGNTAGIETTTAITINLTGSNKITTSGNCFALKANTSFNGSGTLEATSSSNSAISAYYSSVVTLATTSYAGFFGAKYGYWGSGSDELRLSKTTSDDLGYVFQGNSGSIYQTKTLTMTGMDFSYQPSLSYYPGYFEDGSVKANGGGIATHKLGIKSIKEALGIKVAGKELNRVSDASYEVGIASPYITAGGNKAVAYSPSTKTLTLTGATITNNGENLNAIRNESVDGLTINVASNSKLASTTESWGAFYTKKNTTITGNGKLTVESTYPAYCFSVSGGSLTLKDINMSLSGDLKGYTGSGDNYLYVDLTGTKRVEVAGSVYEFTDITFRNGAKLLKPVGGWYDNTNKYVTTGSGKATGIVFASKDATGIAGVTVDNKAEVIGIYDLNGRQLDEMQKGVNILRMSDGSTKKVVNQ